MGEPRHYIQMMAMRQDAFKEIGNYDLDNFFTLDLIGWVCGPCGSWGMYESSKECGDAIDDHVNGTDDYDSNPSYMVAAFIEVVRAKKENRPIDFKGRPVPSWMRIILISEYSELEGGEKWLT